MTNTRRGRPHGNFNFRVTFDGARVPGTSGVMPKAGREDLARAAARSACDRILRQSRRLKSAPAAEAAGAVLFFSEVDVLFGTRAPVRDSHNRYARMAVGYLLMRLEGYRGVAILATNRKDNIDQAFLRRLRFIVNFSRVAT